MDFEVMYKFLEYYVSGEYDEKNLFAMIEKLGVNNQGKFAKEIGDESYTINQPLGALISLQSQDEKYNIDITLAIYIILQNYNLFYASLGLYRIRSNSAEYERIPLIVSPLNATTTASRFMRGFYTLLCEKTDILFAITFSNALNDKLTEKGFRSGRLHEL